MGIISLLFFTLSILNYFLGYMGMVQWLILDIINFALFVFLLIHTRGKIKISLTVTILIMMLLIVIKDCFLIQSVNSMFEVM